MTLHQRPDARWELQLWTHVQITAAGGVSAKRQREAILLPQLPASHRFRIPPGASSACGSHVLLSSGKHFYQSVYYYWAIDSRLVVRIGADQPGRLAPVHWSLSAGQPRLVAQMHHWVTAELDEESGYYSGDERQARRLQIRVYAADGRQLVQSQLLPSDQNRSVDRCVGSPNGAHLAVCGVKELLVLALADCSLLLRLGWPGVESWATHDVCGCPERLYRFFWSPDSLHAYCGSGVRRQHALCSLQTCRWLEKSEVQPSHREWESIRGWGRQGALVFRSDADGADNDILQPISLGRADGVDDTLGAPTFVHGQIADAVLSPDQTWVVLSVLTPEPDMAFSHTHMIGSGEEAEDDDEDVDLCVYNFSGLQFVRSSTGRVAAAWRSAADHTEAPELHWASAGNRLLCHFAAPSGKPQENVLLSFED